MVSNVTSRSPPMNKVSSFFKYMRCSSCVSATGTLIKLPGNNPLQPEGKMATIFADNVVPPLISPVFAYTGNSPTAMSQIVTPGQTNPVAPPPAVPVTVNSSHTTAAVSSVSVPTVPTTHATSPYIPVPSLPSIVTPSIAIPCLPPRNLVCLRLRIGNHPNCLSSNPVCTTSSVPSGQCPSWLLLFQNLQDQEHQEASTWVRIPSPTSPFTSCPTSRFSLRSRLRALINSARCLNLSSFCYISLWAFGALPFFFFILRSI